jgi:hypothetical protein
LTITRTKYWEKALKGAVDLSDKLIKKNINKY